MSTTTSALSIDAAVQKVRQFLLRWKDEAELAKSLAQCGSKGDPSCPWNCVLAYHIQHKVLSQRDGIRCVAVREGAVDVWATNGRTAAVETPPLVAQFIRRFDCGLYPELEDRTGSHTDQNGGERKASDAEAEGLHTEPKLGEPS